MLKQPAPQHQCVEDAGVLNKLMNDMVQRWGSGRSGFHQTVIGRPTEGIGE